MRGKPGRKPAPGESFEAARRRKESALADLRCLEVAKRRGQLLDADAVVREWAAEFRRVRSRMLAVVGRLRQHLPRLTAVDAEAIDREIRAALTELAEDAEDKVLVDERDDDQDDLEDEDG